MKNLCNIVFIICFFAVLFVFSLGTLMKPDKMFSEKENKYLAQKPEFNKEDVISGTYMEDLKKYLDDQLIFREPMIRMKHMLQKKTGKDEINGVYLGEDDYLFEKWLPQDVDSMIVLNNIESMFYFAKENLVDVMVVPTAGYIYEDKLPKNAPMYWEEFDLISIKDKLTNCNVIETEDILFENKDKEELYYHSDHHWTTQGAFLAYQKWCQEKKIPFDENDYEVEEVTHDFQGTMYAKVLDDSLQKDTISIYHDRKAPAYKITYNFGEKTSYTAYERDKLNTQNKYDVFFGGNHPEMTITTENKNGKNLLIFKDSYANSFIPFLIRNYETIHVVDLRYCNYDLKTYIEESNITEYLFMYNSKNFTEEYFWSYLDDMFND